MNLIFFIGTGRCGSTFINNLISKHERVGYISDWEDRHTRFSMLGKLNGAIYRNDKLPLTRKLRSRFSPSEGYRLMSRKASPIIVSPCRDLTADDVTPWNKKKFRKLFEDHYKKQNKPVFIHKYTGWSRIGFLAEIFPEARFIHIVRDGRAVANSWLQVPWWGGYDGPEKWLWGQLKDEYATEWYKHNHSFVVLSGIAWKIVMDSYEQSSKQIQDDRYKVIRYEDFISKPEEITRSVLEYIGLDWSPGFEKHFRRQEIRTSRAKSFETDLTPQQFEDLEKCLREELNKYGY